MTASVQGGTERATLREPSPRSSLQRRVRYGERLAEGLILAVACASVLSVLLILVFVGKEALPVLTSEAIHAELTPGALFLPRPGLGFVWQPVSLEPKYNIVPLFAGTLKITFIALIVAVPLSVLSAIYVSDFAGRQARETIKPIVELLAGIPSVVIGFFALVVLATPIQHLFGTPHRLSALVAGIALAFAVCPIVFSISEDSLRAVPGSYRAAAMALGATRTESLLHVVLPAALPGIAGAVVLGFGRAIGETMIVLLASGNAALLEADWGRSARTVTATIAQELGEVVVGSPHYHVLFALGALLFLSTLGVNVVGERIVNRIRARLRGGPMMRGKLLANESLARTLTDRSLAWITLAATATVLSMLAVVVVVVVHGGASVLSWEFLSSYPSHGMAEGGIFPAIFGTVALTLLMTVAAVPAGVATAVYLSEYAPRQSSLARVVRVCIGNLAGIPSIVFGLFGLGFFVATVGKGIDGLAYGGRVTYGQPCLIWASLTLAILTLPVVVVSTEEALQAVPQELRDASLALGATRLQTVTRVVLPEAMSGILTGGILAVSRGTGEVAPIMFTGAAYYLRDLPTHLNDPFMSLGYHVYVLATQSPDVDRTMPRLYGTVFVLLALTFFLNLAAIALRARTRRRAHADA